jgi:hypothetical protein
MIDITIDNIDYPIPSGAVDTNWASQQVAALQALATAVNNALVNAGVSVGGQNFSRGTITVTDPNRLLPLPGGSLSEDTSTIKLVVGDGSGGAMNEAFPNISPGVEGQEILIYNLGTNPVILFNEDVVPGTNIYMSTESFTLETGNSLRLRFLGGSWQEVAQTVII